MKSKKNGLEIEKRFLLKIAPKFDKYDGCLQITQYYTPSGRFRKTIDANAGKIEFVKTKKAGVSKGVAKEKEWELTEAEFKKAIKSHTRSISKTRFIKKIGKLKWEIDIFDNLVIAEVELENKKELKTVKLPKQIKEVLILDITGIDAFSNYNLADKLKK